MRADEATGAMTQKKAIILLAVLLAAAALAAASAAFFATRTFDLEGYRDRLVRAVGAELQREVRFGRGAFTLWIRPAFVFTDVVILQRDAQEIFLAADRVSLRLALLPLLAKKIVPVEVVLENPRMTLMRDATGRFNVSDLLSGDRQAALPGIGRLRVVNGTLAFSDHRAVPQGLRLSLEKIELLLERAERGKTAGVALSAVIAGAGGRAAVSVQGSVDVAPGTEPLENSAVDVTVKATGLNAAWAWPYYSRQVPFRTLTGMLDIDGRFRGSAGRFESGGSVTLQDLHFSYPQVFPVPLKPEKISAAYEIRRDSGEIAVTRLDVSVDGARIHGSCLLKDLHSDDPLIDAKATATGMSWASHSCYIPYGILPRHVADFIGRKITAGDFRLDEGRLYGRVSQIAHMERGDHCNVLHVRGQVRKGALAYAPDMPAFTDISGALELRGSDFLLSGMTGKFGEAPFSLDGKLADYCLDTPTRYPFTLKMTPTAKEVTWLLPRQAPPKMHYEGPSALQLSGDGTLAEYHLSGDWDLSEAGYGYADWLNKPAGRANRLAFNISAKPGEVRFAPVQYTLPPLSLTLSGRYRPAARRALVLDIETNAVQIEDVVPVLPRIEKFQPRGEIRMAVKAHGGLQDLAGLRWRGEIALAGVSFIPVENIKPVGHATGKIRLLGDAAETSQMTLQLGNSAISARAAIASLRDPSLAVTFGSERFDMADLGLHHPEGPVHLERVSGSAVLSHGDLQVNALNFRINASQLSVSGAVRQIRHHPVIRLGVAAPFLDVKDIRMLGGLRRTKNGGSAAAGAGMDLEAAIQADAGRLDRLAFEHLQTRLSLDRGILYLNDTAFSALGGRLRADSRIDLTDAASPRYQVKFELDRLSAEQSLAFFDVKDRLMTGLLSAKGDLAAKGENGAGLKKTALGQVHIRVEDGMLTRFAVLSKIFSILNVSQLLKFQLPDMVEGGMPYNTVEGTFSFEDGVVSTRDLFLRSDAMNMSVVGAIDLPRGEFAETIVGVQPLQTVDKVVGRIPVVGWILTDENRGFMTVYFEVKGPVDNPAVTAIPVKAIARGIFDIFKNIFQLPAKLFTDTGEVIFGR